MHDCDAFLGADGGLMHLAVACDLPGLAVFVEIDPAMRLLPGTRLRSLFTDGAIGNLPADRIAMAWLEALRPYRP
jgi:ADP-heptose:LPS heptosyltransferase